MSLPTGPIVVMGVAGCGKSTIGALLAERLGVPYVEADDFHPRLNVDKMARGTPLTDLDRQPWLEAIANRIAAAPNGDVVVSCSALKRRYRDTLRTGDPRAWFLHLVIDFEAAAERVSRRTAHFMPTSLVASQFAALEPLRAEAGLAVWAARPVESIVAEALEALAARAGTELRSTDSTPGG